MPTLLPYLYIIIASQIVNQPRRSLGGLRPHPVPFSFRNERKLMDRIFEATSMSGYEHPLRVSVFVGVVEYVDDDVIVESNALSQSISSSDSADSSGRCCCCCCCCCKCGWYCWRWRSKAACWRLYKYVMVCSCSLRNVWMCVVVVCSLRLLVGRCTPAAGVYASLDIV